VAIVICCFFFLGKRKKEPRFIILPFFIFNYGEEKSVKFEKFLTLNKKINL